MKEITKKSLAAYIDHTLLKPDATKAQIRKICEEALEHGFFAVCINSSMVGICREVLRGTKINIASTVGFPLGAADTSTKAFETNRALNLGATEIDMVLHIGLLKAQEYSLVERDIQDVIRSAEGKKVKVTLETALLTQEEKKKACEIALAAGAHFVKTCTGFGGGGATVADVELIKSIVGEKSLIKASGGIKDFEFAKNLIMAGANRLGTSSGVVLVSSAPSDSTVSNGDYKMIASEIIKKKRNGEQLSAEEINAFILDYTVGKIPDYQMSALLMAIYFQGMNTQETLALTKTMLHSGTTVNTAQINGFKADKHSTGGVGDKTSLILGPIVAACGIYVPMISGRGLGHTGGTLDKLESITGFNTQLPLQTFVAQTKQLGLCFIGQTKEICPADKKIYALRDVTATVESLPLICASIMSKKLAEGIDGLVLDVKFGSGAFMKTFDQARTLAQSLMSIGQGHGKKVTALLTSMDQPLGRYAGNGWEVFECVEILNNKKYAGHDGYDLYADTRELSLQLATEMIFQSGKYISLEDSYNAAKHALESGEAHKKFQEMCAAQGGDLGNIQLCHEKLVVRSIRTGFISEFNVEKIGIATLQLKAGRTKVDDVLDLSSGIEFHKKIGDFTEKGAPLFTIYCQRIEDTASAADTLSMCYSVSEIQPANKHLLIKERLT